MYSFVTTVVKLFLFAAPLRDVSEQMKLYGWQLFDLATWFG